MRIQKLSAFSLGQITTKKKKKKQTLLWYFPFVTLL